MKRPHLGSPRDLAENVVRALIIGTAGTIATLATGDPMIGLVIGAVVALAAIWWKSPEERAQTALNAKLEDQLIGHNEQIGQLEYESSPAGRAEAAAEQRRMERYGPTHGSR